MSRLLSRCRQGSPCKSKVPTQPSVGVLLPPRPAPNGLVAAGGTEGPGPVGRLGKDRRSLTFPPSSKEPPQMDDSADGK